VKATINLTFFENKVKAKFEGKAVNLFTINGKFGCLTPPEILVILTSETPGDDPWLYTE
jgi:hypothetical protein